MEFIYKGLKENYEHITVTDSEVDKQLERIRQQTPAIQVITGRAAALGDQVVLDYAGFSEGVQFEGGTAEMQTLTLGSGAFIPGFEEQLVGKWPEEEVTVKVTFPTEYPHEALAGKDAEFRCVVHEIRTTSEYALDDRFAQEVGKCKDLAEMREKLKKNLQEVYDDRSEQELMDRLVRKATETLDYVPEKEQVEKALDEQMEGMEATLTGRGLTMELYCQFMGTTKEQLREDMRPEAEQNLKMITAIGRIAGRENISADQFEVARACAEVCRENNISTEQLESIYNEEFAEALARSVVYRKVMKLLRESSEITVVEL